MADIIIPDIYNSSIEKYADGSIHIPKDLGSLKLLKKECPDKLIYYDWDLSFKNQTFASRPDNFGKDEIQVIFNLNQCIDWQIEGGRETVRMRPGEVCVFRNNNYETSMSYAENITFQFKSLQMKTEYFEKLLSRYFPSERIEESRMLFLSHVAKTVITQDMYRVLSEIDSAEKYQEFKGVFIEAKMIELIALVLYGISHNKTSALPCEKSSVLSASGLDVKRMEELRRQIQFNPSDDYRVPEIAKNLSMSVSKLTRLFRSLYGMPVHRYIQNQKLERAATLIAQGEMNVSEAAIKSGYNNMSHFSKEFRKKFGVVPKKFRRELEK